MRIAVFGAGVTTPLVVGSLLNRRTELGLDRVVVHDDRPDRLAAVRPLLELLELASGTRVTPAPTAERVRLLRPDCCVVSIRPGLEAGRSADERRAHALGQLANETVGAAGLAFACRAVPGAVRLLETVIGDRPDCLVINFTNPAGIVTSALRASGFVNTYGVCSSAEKSVRQLARHLGHPAEEWTPSVYGLNHCSWVFSLRHGDTEALPGVLASDGLVAACQPWFDAGLPRRLGVLLNEYLHYYLQLPRALREQRSAGRTRAEFVEQLNHQLRARLAATASPQEAVAVYGRYLATRKHSYEQRPDTRAATAPVQDLNDDDGYSGPALKVLRGALLGEPVRVACLLPRPLDGTGAPVGVESTVTFAGGTASPVEPPAGPPELVGLVRRLARYEAAVQEAIRCRRVDGLVDALDEHPVSGGSARNGEFVARTVADWPAVFAGWQGAAA